MNEKLLPNFTMVPHLILDEWMPNLSGAEFKVIMLVARKTYGWRKDSDTISIDEIVRLTGLGRSTVILACNTLEEKKYLLCTIPEIKPNERMKPNNYALNLDAVTIQKFDTSKKQTRPKIRPIQKTDPQKKGLYPDPFADDYEENKMPHLSLEDSANANAVASLPSDFDAVSYQATEDAEAERGATKPSGYKPRGRASTTRQERAAIEALYQRFATECRGALLMQGFVNDNDEISKYLEVLLAATKAGKTPDDMAKATVACIKAYDGKDFTVTVASVCRHFLYKPKPTRAVEQTEDAPRRITNAERFRQMAENGGMPEL